MTIVLLDNAKGLCVEYEQADQDGLVIFVKEVVEQLRSVSLGKEFLAEFVPGSGKPSLGEAYGHCTAVVVAPTAVSAKTTAAMQTLAAPVFKFGAQAALEKCKAQRVIAWWPGSENTSVRKGMKVMPAEWTSGTVKMETSVSKRTGAPKFYYHGHRETYAIALIHELIHAYHGITGLEADDKADEESQTVGLKQHFSRKYTENKFRVLFNLPLRLDYKSISILQKKDIEMVKNLESFCDLVGMKSRLTKADQ